MTFSTLRPFLLPFLFVACGISPEGNTTTNDDLRHRAVLTYANIAHATYVDTRAAAGTLSDSIDAFLAAPNAQRLEACHSAWRAARIPYALSEAFRFVDGPIDAANGPESLLNAWPLDEAYIDGVEGLPNAGIINDPAAYPVIDGTLLTKLNEAGGETNVSAGYHAIEFLLWGQDRSTTGAGDRPFTDFTTAPNADRRGAYLRTCMTLVLDQLDHLVSAWAPERTDNYRHGLEHGDVDSALTNVLQGMSTLAKAELAGERLEVAYDTQLQEDEQSCFSDHTQQEMAMNALGLRNVFLGTYQRPDGTSINGIGIKDVIAAIDGVLADSVVMALGTAVSTTAAIPVPFDRQLDTANTEGRERVHAAMVALKQTGGLLFKARSRLVEAPTTR